MTELKLADRLPPPGENNLWYDRQEADTVIVFVHGIFSDSRNCWLYKAQDGTTAAYWPELVRTDARIGPTSIFLAGFYTALDAGDYDLANCAYEVFSALQRKDMEGHD